MFIYLIVFFAITIFGAKAMSKGKFHEDFLSLKISKGIQGVCAILIIAHHFVQNLLQSNQSAGVLNIFLNAGILFVSVFFFFSGYGLYKSYKNKPGYLKGFLRKRLPVVLVPLYLTNTLFAVIVFLTGTKYYMDMNPLSFGMDNLVFRITTLLGITLMNSNAWFVITITVFYIAFYLIFKNCTSVDKAVRNIGIFTVIYAILCICAGFGLFCFMGEWWYNSSFLFFIGMIFAKHEEKIVSYMKANYKILLPTFLILSVMTYYLQSYISDTISAYRPGLAGKCGAFLCYVTKTICEIVVLGAGMLVTMKIQFNNKIMDFLGKIALEIYLIHRLFLGIFRCQVINITNNVLFGAAVYACTLVSAILLHGIDHAIVSLFKKHKKDDSKCNECALEN